MGIYPPPKLDQLSRRDVRFGSKADIEARPVDVRLPPKADMRQIQDLCQLEL